jgi:hypothetical protein
VRVSFRAEDSMRSRSTGTSHFAALVACASLVGLAASTGCSGTRGLQGFLTNPDGGSGADGTSVLPGHPGGPDGTTGPTGPLPGNDSGTPTVHLDGGTTTTTVCPAGIQCNVSCTGSATTTITGSVYDPGGNDPLYNVEVYVPQTPLEPLPATGVLTGANACSCGALFESGAVVSTTTGVDGSFTLKNAPVGSSVPLVMQIGKWRHQVNIPVSACQANPQPAKSLKLPSSIVDPNDSMPQIAVSTGAYDTLECLMTRIGLPASEYVAGPGGTGHVHIYSGGQDGSAPGGTGRGQAESPPMSGAPESYQSLWDSQAHLMAYDIVLLSCEGDETYNSNAANLELYLNAGGRAFGSHYHYAWFAGSLQGENVPAPPSDWGSHIADWQGESLNFPTGSATVVQTLNGSNQPFQKGEAMYQWLASNGALGVEGAQPGQIPVFDENGDVGATVEAQAWLTDSGDTDYLSFNTPINQPPSPDGGAPAYCGRAVFADMHVSSDPNFPTDSNPPPGGCSSHALSPQEKALEFMLFDLSSCVVPDTITVSADAGLPPPPPMAK